MTYVKLPYMVYCVFPSDTLVFSIFSFTVNKKMESMKQITIYDEEYEISESDRDCNFLQRLDMIRNNIILCGQSLSGKSSLLQNMLIKCYVHEIKPENIYIFSRTASYDMAY